ncbi:MAG: methylenetetrahydrofolate reductase [NAD(P)H] [Planctomycetota bacterium]
MDIATKLEDLRARGLPAISFELFPPKTPEAEETLLRKGLPELAALDPCFISLTYGAGGSTRGSTLRIAAHVARDLRVDAMAHLTCVGATRPELTAYLEEARGQGIENILALRGDPPAGQASFRPVEGGFTRAVELVQLLRSMNGFSIGVAGFPEGHPDCPGDKYLNWEHLKQKVDAGAQFVITQLFFDNRAYFEFAEYMKGRLGVRVPIVPGILPFLSAAQLRRMTSMCGATIPPALQAGLERIGDDDEAMTEFGIEYTTEQCAGLLQGGAPGIHFYTLNRARSVKRILAALGLRGSGA